MLEWIIWGLLLMIQNGANTLSVRARNGTNLRYSAVGGTIANLAFILNLYIGANKLVEAKATGNTILVVGICAFYTVLTTVGATAMHWFAMRFLERKFNGPQGISSS